MIKCPQCGYDNTHDLRYCGNCGKNLTKEDLVEKNEDNIYMENKSFSAKKLDLKALLIGSVSIPVIMWILSLIIESLYDSYIIPYDGLLILIPLSIIFSGIIGMIIFNKLNHEEKSKRNILIINALSIIVLLIISTLNGNTELNIEFLIIFFIMTSI